MNRTTSLPSLTVQREIEATPEELFDAWLDPASLVVWMRGCDTTDVVARVDPRVAGAFEIVMKGPSGAHVHTGTYRIIERPHRLMFTWISSATKQTETLVTVEFLGKGTRTNVVITHEQLPDRDAILPHRMGWTQILDQLAEHAGAA